MDMQDKVTIITPTWNSEKYIRETIRSVQAQSYQNWEMILVDDGSSDHTVEIAMQIADTDPRIKVIRQPVNRGAASARNRALAESSGRFIAYLDADDLWMPEKLAVQTAFMKANDCGFSCASYEVIGDDGVPKNKTVHMLPRVNYTGFLTNNLLQTVGIMVDTHLLDRKYLVMPDLKRRQDAATWLQILRAGYDCYGLPEVLGQYRRSKGSLSSNKWKAVRNIWTLYRQVEQLPLSFSCYCFVRYAALAVWKRLYPVRSAGREQSATASKIMIKR